MYKSGTGHKDAADNHYCSNKCYNEAMKDPSIASEVSAAIERERRRRENEARRQREEAARREKEAAEERARKADPNRWYPEEWVEHLKTKPEAASRCPWSRLDIRSSMWVELLKVQPVFWNKCHKFNSFGCSDWDLIMDGLLKQSSFKLGIESRLNGSGWAVLLSKSLDYDSKCVWESLGVSDWAWLLRTRSEFARNCTCWSSFHASDWCDLLSRKPFFWTKAWRCDWFDVPRGDWKKLPLYTIPFQVFMFIAGNINRFLTGIGGLYVLAAIVVIILWYVL
jgi:hypothetical protein